MNPAGAIGRKVIGSIRNGRHLAALVAMVVATACRPAYWPVTVRSVFARQLLFTGVEAVRLVSLIAFLGGVSIVLQAQVWLNRMGQSGLLGPLLVIVLVREVGPLLTNFIVIGRSGTAIAAEMASMRAAREIEVLDAQGLDPFTYLLMPRVLGVAVSVFLLTMVFIVVSFASGYVTGLVTGAATGGPGLFVDSILGAMRPVDVVSLLAKTFIPGMLTGAICCEEGLKIKGALTEIPQATTRGQVKSIIAVFLVSAVISVLTYL